MEKLLVFTVLKPQGIKGDLKIKLFTDSFESIKGIKTVYDESGKEYEVRKIRDDGSNFAIIFLGGCETRNDAELYRDKSFYADKKDIKKEKDSFFIDDLIGLKLFVKGEEKGVIKDVLSGNVDMFQFKDISTGKIGYFPFLKSLNISVDLEKGMIDVKGENFMEVAYFED